jgi:hypothetical protein
MALLAFVPAAFGAWALATEHTDRIAVSTVTPRAEAKWPFTQARGIALRHDAIRRAQVRLVPPAAPQLDVDVLEPSLHCRFLAEAPTGTSSKFDCVLDDGQVIKVKYGRNPEIVAEVAGTRLLAALGYPADRMTISPHIRCDGCPREPFLAMRLLALAGLHGRFATHGIGEGYSDFEWVAVERKFAAPAIEVNETKGWSWWELKAVDPAVGASTADLDALRLVAVFLAHWDNKSENQRLVCLDENAGTDKPCQRPIAMLQDLGATFGPTKANLARWRDTPVWADRATCAVSMEHLPFKGGTFPERRISEAGRAQLAAQLTALSDNEVRALFRAARFPEYYASTDDEKDLDAWTGAFAHRRDQIVSAGPCPQ